MILSSSRSLGLIRISLDRCQHRAFSTSPAFRKTCDPLRILFCGSDDFSIASLRALNAERTANELTRIESIDVVCRPGKRTGRGLKTITHPPIRSVAENLDLKLHEVDTFTGWEPPRNVNLIIAVSFGLLVPGRILGQAKYGGLNVHASMLPDLRGAAPLQHALLQRRTHTGVSLQTLHPTKFDHGKVLAQTPLPGLPIPPGASPKNLENLLAPLGAELLVQSIRERRFVDPTQPLQHSEAKINEMTNGKGLARAPKITPEDRRIDWNEMSNAEILLRSQVLGRSWDDTTYAEVTGHKENKRITYGKWSTTSAYNMCSWFEFRQGNYVGVPVKDLGSGKSRIAVGKSAQLMREDLTTDEGGEMKRIYTTNFTVEGRPKDTGGMYFAELLRHRETAGWPGVETR